MGTSGSDTTAKRGAVMGLNFLTNPARQLALRVMPASWLDLQLSYLNSFDKSSRTQAQTSINFTNLRDAAHLCLHATQTFIEEVVNHQDVKAADIEHQQQLLNVLYEWFHNAHNVYQLHSSATQGTRGPPGLKTRDRWSREQRGDGDRPLTHAQRTVSILCRRKGLLSQSDDSCVNSLTDGFGCLVELCRLFVANPRLSQE